MERSDWAALLAAAVQVAYRHDTRPFLLPLAKGLARQTRRDVEKASGVGAKIIGAYFLTI